MVFSDSVFICVFLPIVLAGYYICPKRLRNSFLLLVSLVPLLFLFKIKDADVVRMNEEIAARN